MTKQITMFKEADGQWASRFNFRDNIDIDVTVTELSDGFITSVNVIRAEYKDGLVMCNSLDEYDILLTGKEFGANGIIERNHTKIKTMDRPICMDIYKFRFEFQYEE